MDKCPKCRGRLYGFEWLETNLWGFTVHVVAVECRTCGWFDTTTTALEPVPG